MQPFRFVHTADLHLDSPFRGLAEIAPQLKSRLQEATFSAFHNIVDVCIAREVDCLLIAGDLHDAANRSLRSMTRLRDQFCRLHEHAIPVFICHGNHDPLGEWEMQFSWPENVHVFGAGTVQPLPLIRKGTELARIYGISYATERVTENLAQSFKKQGEAPWSIGLLHTNVGNDSNHLNYAPCELQDLVQAGMDYWALGHIHAHQVLAERPLVVYPGNPQGRNPRETGPRGCYLVSVDHHGDTQYEFIPVDVVRWHQTSVSIQEMTGLEDLWQHLEGRMRTLAQESEGRDGVIRWKLVGRGPLHGELCRTGRLDDILATLRDRAETALGFMWSESIQDGTAREADLEQLRKEENLLGDFLRLSSEEDPDLIEELQQTLKTLLEDPRLRRYLDVPKEEGIKQLFLAAQREGLDQLLPDEEGG